MCCGRVSSIGVLVDDVAGSVWLSRNRGDVCLSLGALWSLDWFSLVH
jgi:hypothetical protein